MSHNKETTRVIASKLENEHIDITYPQLNLKHKKVENKINNAILDIVLNSIKNEIHKFLEQRDVYGEYKITLNKNDLLSVAIEFDFYLPGQDISFNLLKTLTINAREGFIYNFNDLFNKESNYEYVISRMILENMKENSIPIIEEFADINENRKFYITENSLEIYYELNRNSKYASIYCIPQFEIPFKSIKDIINPKGPIGKLI